MRKKMYWGITSLILIIGVVGVYFMLQPESDTEPKKKFIVPSEADLEKARETRKPPPGASPNGQRDPNGHRDGHESDETIVDVSDIPSQSTDVFSDNSFVDTEPPTDDVVEPDVRVSPFGFGAFPQIPEGFPTNIRIPWQWQEIPYKAPQELAVRVLIKLWEQGDTHFTGAQYTDDYKIFPHYPNTAYVRYSDRISDDGTLVRVISSVKGGPDLPDITPEMMATGIIPGMQLISEEQGGIDALHFLNLE